MDRAEVTGLARACGALAAGAAVIVPNPAPMAYGIVSTGARAVNALKGRPLEQNVGVSLHAPSQWDLVVPSIDLSPSALDAVVRLLRQHLTVLVPLRGDVPPPDWVAPAVRSGLLAVFNGYWDATSVVWQQFPRLYGSSANLAGHPPAANAAEAEAMFGSDCAVVNGDAIDDESLPRSASTMVRIDRAGRLELYRSGAHDDALAQLQSYTRQQSGHTTTDRR